MTGTGFNREATATRAAPQARRGFTLIELLVVIVIIAIIVALALPNYVRVKEKAREAETKANLHNIQLVLERFAVDSEGTYPSYLIGGNNRWVETLRIKLPRGDREILQEIYHEEHAAGMSDPLLRSGYLYAYPRNPFVRNGKAVNDLQAAVGDPLRSGSPARVSGTRFGADGGLMGQTLCEARWLTWTHVDIDKATREERNTWANVQYEFYDVWLGNKPRPYLPGSFLYKSSGEIVPSGRDIHSVAEIERISQPGGYDVTGRMAQAALPVAVTDYILGGWGGLRTKGMDLLGEEPLVVFSVPRGRRQYMGPLLPLDFFGPGRGSEPTGKQPARPTDDSGVMIGIPAWTRGVNRSHVGPLWGSPYGPANETGEQVTYGNANGIRDGVILWLSPGLGN